MAEVILGIGGNEGDRLRNLLLAGGRLSEKLGMITAFSPVIESEPWGFSSEKWFLNQILIIETESDPGYLLEVCNEVEKMFGRERTASYTDRSMDIDILFYNGLVLKKESLEIPHPRLHDRLFILKPLVLLRPDLIHPVLGMSIAELLNTCRDKSRTRWLKGSYSSPLLP